MISHSHVFDPWINIPADQTLTSNNLNQIASINGTTLTYDLNGNLLSDSNHLYTHNAVNRLVGVDGIITYAYDALGRRVSKTVNGTVTRYVYDGARVIAEYDGAGQLLRKYIYGPGIDEPILMQAGATHYYYLSDSLGSVIGLTDATGTLVEAYRYSPYGQPLQASSVGNPYMFTGRWFDSESGLYYYRARYYSPQLRRFIEPDPIGFEGGMNLYAYVGNDPANAVDPWGLYRSLGILRYTVPGQILFDHGMTAMENGNYGRAVAYFAGMVAEQALFALTFGESATLKGVTTCDIGITGGQQLTVETTIHGAERIAGTATRGGVLSVEEIVAVRMSGSTMTQADGAIVRILQNTAGRYNVVIEGNRGIITTFQNLSEKSLDRLARNYGWR